MHPSLKLLFAGLLLTSFSAGSISSANPEPPRTIPVEEVDFDDLSNKDVGPTGAVALEFNADKWRHAETPNFVLHFRRVTEARKVAREVEYDLWYVAEALGASRESYEKKSHVFVFEDEEEWQAFLAKVPDVPQWSSSFAYGDELFLNVRNKTGPNRFESDTLAHECTHAVVARLYPTRRWPLWLSEGFAEYMATASVAARKSQTIKRHQRDLDYAELRLEQLTSLTAYPDSPMEVAQLYQSGEKLVRFLYGEFPPERFPKFVEAVLDGADFKKALLAVYGDRIDSYEDFEKDYAKFRK